MTLRRFVFWCHLCVGIFVGLVMAFLAVTGSLLVFQAEGVHFAERSYRIQQPTTVNCVASSSLLTAAEGAAGEQPTSLTLFSDPRQPAEAAVGHEHTILLNSCSGAVVAKEASALRPFFYHVRELHQSVTLRGIRHERLRALKNASNLGLLFLILSGLVIWLPRKFTWQHIRPSVLLRLKARGRARDWNWHNVAAIWFATPLILISVTGAVMAYPWANALLYRAAGDTVPPPRTEREGADSMPIAPKDYVLLDAAIVAARQADSSWKSMEMRVPKRTDKAILFTVEESSVGTPQTRMRLQVNRKTATVGKVERFADMTAGRRWRLYARFLHTGELFGIVGKTIAALAMIALLILVWTGFALSLRRYRSWSARRMPKMASGV